MENNILMKARQCGFSNAMKEDVSAEVKAGQKVFIGMDYAHGKDKTIEIVRLPDSPFNLIPNYITTDYHGRYYITGEEYNPSFITEEEVRQIVAFNSKMNRKLLSMPFFEEKNPNGW